VTDRQLVVCAVLVVSLASAYAIYEISSTAVAPCPHPPRPERMSAPQVVDQNRGLIGYKNAAARTLAATASPKPPK
jgi:hypothetical protein